MRAPKKEKKKRRITSATATDATPNGSTNSTSNTTAYKTVTNGWTYTRESGTYSWGDPDCKKTMDRLTGNDGDECYQCQEASDSCLQEVICGVIAMIPTLLSDFKRANEDADTNFEKVTGMYGGIIGSILVLTTLATYVNDCISVFPDKFPVPAEPPLFPNGSLADADTPWGAGLILLSISTGVLFLDGVIHCLVKTPPRCWEEQDVKNPCPCCACCDRCNAGGWSCGQDPAAGKKDEQDAEPHEKDSSSSSSSEDEECAVVVEDAPLTPRTKGYQRRQGHTTVLEDAFESDPRSPNTLETAANIDATLSKGEVVFTLTI